MRITETTIKSDDVRDNPFRPDSFRSLGVVSSSPRRRQTEKSVTSTDRSRLESRLAGVDLCAGTVYGS